MEEFGTAVPSVDCMVVAVVAILVVVHRTAVVVHPVVLVAEAVATVHHRPELVAAEDHNYWNIDDEVGAVECEVTGVIVTANLMLVFAVDHHHLDHHRQVHQHRPTVVE